MKKKLLIIIPIIVLLFFLFMVFFVSIGTNEVNKNSKEEIIFKLNSGSSKIDIVNDLDKAGLIKNKYSAYVYVLINRGKNLQAGTYALSKSMDLKTILNKFDKGQIVDTRKVIDVTFVEGKRITEYAKQISKITNISYDDVMKEICDKKYINELIDKYWFLTDEVLDSEIYYPLEGYLFPNTYQFYTDATVKQIIEKMLDQTSVQLKKYEDDIKKSKFSVHEILSMAAIIEKEANSLEDRKMVSQVIYKRLDVNMSLGMDVTAYYAAKADLSEPYYKKWTNLPSKYNTRNVNNKGLPIGPICNSSASSIVAALNPSETDYLYFFADVTTGKVYFAEDEYGFNEIQKKLGV